MNRADILTLLDSHGDSIKREFGVANLALFGSAARDELRLDSDIDFLVDFAGAATFDRYFGLKDWLEEALGRPVDLVTSKGLKPRARKQVEKELVRVA